MSRQTALFTVALLLTFLSTQVIHTTAAEPASSKLTQKSKAKMKKARRHSHKPRKHNSSSASNRKNASEKQ